MTRGGATGFRGAVRGRGGYAGGRPVPQYANNAYTAGGYAHQLAQRRVAEVSTYTWVNVYLHIK